MLIDCYIETGSIDMAKALLEEIKLVDQDSRYNSLAGKIELAEQILEYLVLIASLGFQALVCCIGSQSNLTHTQSNENA